MNKFTAVMTSRSNAELLEITVKLRNEYQIEALEAAEAELAKRGLNQTEIEDAENELRCKEKEDLIKANLPLQIHWKVLTFIFPGVINIIIAGTFKSNGYQKRFRQAWLWTLYGGLTYIGVFLLFLLFFYFAKV